MTATTTTRPKKRPKKTASIVPKKSARERYRELRQAEIDQKLTQPAAADEPLFDFKAPSGMEFKLRRPDLTLFANMGTLPTGLANKVAMGESGSDEYAAKLFTSLPETKQKMLIEQSANIVRYVCVDPRIVDDPQADDEIAPEDVTLKDFRAIVAWATGGRATELGTFRRE